METFKITVDGQHYHVNALEEPDQIFYEISQGQVLTTIGLNENGKWEATTDIDPKLVEKFGLAIEDFEA